MLTTVFFDLDGTLTDSRPGILASYREAFERCGLEPGCDVTSDACIGPPLRQVLATLVREADRERLGDLYEAFQVRFTSTGWSENAVYAGVPELLGALADAGVTMHVATSKARVHAVRIVEHFGLRPFFGEIYGAEPDGSRANKTALLGHALECERVDPATAVMVGDRSHDIEAARAHGVRGVGIGYGYGTADELLHAGAEVIVGSPGELRELLLGGQGALT